LQQAASFLAAYYAVLAGANLLAAGLTAARRRPALAGMWLAVAVVYGCFVPLAASGRADRIGWISLPEGVKDASTWLLSGRAGPVVFWLGLAVLLVVAFLGRRFFVRPPVAWGLLNVSLLLFGFSLPDRHFADVVGQPDNVAILLMLFSFAFFLWLGAYQAVRNDVRLERGDVPLEKERCASSGVTSRWRRSGVRKCSSGRIWCTSS
jgi:hypothetical protein